MSRQLGAGGEALIKGFEQLRLTAYKRFPTEPWTIGWGHTRGVQPGDTCTVDQAQAWFLEDTGDAVRAVDAEAPPTLTQNQFDALVSFGFNVGLTAEAHSTLLRCVNAGDMAGAASEFMKWNHVNGQVSDGLTRRRKAERDLFLAA